MDLIGPLPITARGKLIITWKHWLITSASGQRLAALQDKTAECVALFLYDLFCRYNYAYQSLVQPFIDV